MNGLDDAHHFHFDQGTFGTGCEETLIASKEDRPAQRDRDVSDAAKDFTRLADPQGLNLATAVQLDNSTAFAYVLSVCTANGVDVAAQG